MSPEQKSNHWQPCASVKVLKQRAATLEKIRAFFAERDILEVETPLLNNHTVTDPHIDSLQITNHPWYLQTSPEYFMKRLLAAGSGSIYQLCKAFRQDEQGRFHQPEFTLLEWYHLGFDHFQLMDEVEALLQIVLTTTKTTRISYQQLFIETLNIDPFVCTTKQLIDVAKQNTLDIQYDSNNKDDWLQLLFSHLIEPSLKQTELMFIYDFPASQAALARLSPTNPQVAERFEVFYQGIELANGFHELTDATEQRQRFEQDLCYRQKLDKDNIIIDEQFLAALMSGLPDCSGVALGFDRLMMLACEKQSINEVISFATKNESS